MSLLFSQRTFGGLKAENLIPYRSQRSQTGSVSVTAETALRSSAVWACLRLRADLISTIPVDSFRRVGGVQVETTKPPLLVQPGGEKVHITEWLYSSQFDLDRYGNAFGLITQRDANGRPARVDLQLAGEVRVKGTGADITEYKIGRESYDPRDVWHEKQYTVGGLPMGLSPIAYGAWSIGGYLSAQQFALDWFASDANPSGTLKHTQNDEISSEVAQVMKERFKASVANRDIFVTGQAWEYTPAAADASQAAFLEQMKFGVTDVCRFLGVPGDMIDAEGSKSSITYANITQRNLQLLVMNLGPAITRREVALSNALSRPTYVKFNTDALLRMDPAGVTTNLAAQIEARLRTPSEGREALNLPPLTDSEFNEFDRLFPPKPGSGMAPAGAYLLPYLNLPGADAPAPTPPPAGVTP